LKRAIGRAPGAPYDGHTLAVVLPEIESQIGVGLIRILADAGYNFRLLIIWLKFLLAKIIEALSTPGQPPTTLARA
jgi:hypothetical protein